MQPKYLLDTNICIYIIKKKPISVLQKFKQLKVGCLGMSVITYGELIYEAQKSNNTLKATKLLEELKFLVPVIDIPDTAGKYYGVIRSDLSKAGTPIGNNDLWIAAHALSLDLTVVSNNLKEFSRIDRLKLENWV